MQPSEEQTLDPKKKRSTLKVVAICVATGAVGIGAVLYLGVRPFVNRRILPQIQTALEESLSTEVDLGSVNAILPWQVSLGATEIEGFATVDRIDIRTNPLKLLLKQPTSMEVELHRPDITLVESEDGSWQLPQLQLEKNGDPPPITLDSAKLIVRRGHIRVQPQDGNAVELSNIFVDGRWDAGEESLDFDVRTKLDSGKLELVGRTLLPTLAVDAEAIAKNLPVNSLVTIFPQLPLQPEGGMLNADLQLAWQLNQSPNIEGNLTLDNVSASLPQLSGNQTISNLDGQFSFQNQTIQIDKFEGNLGEIPFTSEGTVEWSDLLDWEQLKLPIPLPAESVSWLPRSIPPRLAYPEQLGAELISSDEPIFFAVPASHHPGDRDASIAQQPTQAKPGIDVTVSIPRATFQELLDVAGLELPVPVEGAVTSTFQLKGTVTRPILEGEFEAIEPGKIDRIELPSYAGRFRFADSQFTLVDLDAQMASAGTRLGTILGTGIVSIGDPVQGNVQLKLSGVNADALLALYDIADLPVVLGSTELSVVAGIAGTRLNAVANWEGSGGSITWGGNAQLALNDGGFSVPKAQLRIEDGTIDATLASSLPNSAGVRALEATVTPRNIPLSLASPQLSGVLNGDVSLQARTDNLNLAGLRGQGQIDLQQVADLGDFVADVEWDGGGLNINNGLALDAIAVNGRIPVNSETFAIGPVALALVADNLQLETLPVLSSQPIGGIVSFQGTITGPLDNLRLAANATANSLAIAALAFEPLQGPVNWQANQGVSLDLVESGSADDTEPDRIFLTTGADFFPTKVNVRQGITTIDGARQNDLLNLQVVQVPLSLLNGILPGYFGGTLDSTLAVNLQDRSVMGDFVAEQPHWAGLKVSRLESGFSFSNNVVTLNNGQLALEGTVIEANGSVTLPSNTGSFMRGGRLVRNQPLPAQVDLFVSAENGKLEDVLAGLDWNEWSDIIQSFEIPELGTAEDLRTNPILSWQRSLYDQISAYAYIVDRLDSAVVSDPRIPNLANLKGDFQGDIRLVGLLNNPIAQVDFQGENWSLEEFLIEKLELNGLLKDLQLNITTFTAKTDNRFATARGTFGLDEIEGAIQVNEFPIELLQRFVPSSPSFSGDLSLTTDLAGSLSNPKVEGDMRLDQATFNEEPIYAVLGDYSYQNSILQLNGSMAINSADIDDPATLVGTIPYQFPLVTVPPKSDRFAVQIEARDSELIFVNLLTDAIALQSPKGELLVGFQGRFDGKTIHDLTLAGNLSLRDTTLDAIASPEPLTNLNTRVFFDFDRIHVESFSTDFVGGQITAAGFLPVSEPDKLDSDMSPLTIAIDPTQIELPDLYNGKVSGDIAIAGSLLAPKISGEVNVWEGFVDISPRNTQATVTASVGTYQPPSPSPIQPEFDGFKLVLGDRLNIGWEPIFRFTAKGDLSLYGPLDSPQGEGTISLTRGAITAGPAFLRLDRSWPNTAVFSRENGLDPDLNVRVFTRAEEIDRSTGGGDPKNEVVQFTGQNGQGSDFSARRTGSTRTIEIRATVQGKASKLAGGLDSSTLVFSSVPDRSQSEIRNLLAQSIVSDLVGTALESTVTSTLFGGENAIGDRLGLDEVSIGTFYGRKNETSLGLEVARDLGRNISISAEGSLTEQEEDPRLGLRYRVNNSWLLRGRSDFNRDTRGSIEFETRF